MLSDISMGLDAQIISYVVRRPDALVQLQRAGVEPNDFVKGYDRIWQYICRIKKQHGIVPSKTTLESRFSKFEYIKTRENDLSFLLSELKRRKKWQELLDVIDYAATNAGSPDDVEKVLEVVQSRVNGLAYGSDNGAHLVDVFSKEASQQLIRDIRERRDTVFKGLPTGLKRIDKMGGLQRGRMVTVVGRLATGKSWINLLFVANAVRSGAKVLLYPLEMTLEETAYRLYAIFSLLEYGSEGVLKNTDLSKGNVSKKKLVRFLKDLEQKYAGQLHIANIGTMHSPYTLERIEAEVDLYRPDMFWIDYLTLLKAPPGHEKEYTAVRSLSSGIKNMAMRYKCVGGASAQINREAMKGKAFIPRPETIAFGDSIGQDSDQIIGINKKDEYLYYGLVKNRHGPEIPLVRVKFFPDVGLISEDERQIEEEDDD